MFGTDSPDLRFEARAPRSKTPAIMGDVIRSKNASFLARVLGAEPYELVVFKDREPIHLVPVTSSRLQIPLRIAGTGSLPDPSPARHRDRSLTTRSG
jgi:hypothetical protein